MEWWTRMPATDGVHRRRGGAKRGRRVLAAIVIAIAVLMAVWAGFIGDFAMLVIALVVAVALIVYYAMRLSPRAGTRT